jgi:NhaA family Na+:H+ antiporter
MTTPRPLPRPIRDFIQAEASGGILLLAATLAALIWANAAAAGYHELWHRPLGLVFGERRAVMTLGHWINDGLMAVFFFWVGLEIKREMLTGELASWKRAALPIMGALGGMVVPAALYAALNAGGEGSRGWGIPMATDIAFAVGILMVLGSRVPTGLKVFLTALAVVDDLGAVIVIAMFYTAALSLDDLAAGCLLLGVLALLGRYGIRAWWFYLAAGVIVWVLFLRSGVHATVAGVLTAWTVPHRVRGPSPLERWEHALAPWVTYAIMPVFALANAGVTLHPSGLAGQLLSPVPLGILLGLVVGKQAGILGFSWLAVRMGWADLPTGARWRIVHGVAVLGGIGFTMSLFITHLAFPEARAGEPPLGQPGLLDRAKLGTLLGSLISAVLGTLLLLAPGRGGAKATA